MNKFRFILSHALLMSLGVLAGCSIPFGIAQIDWVDFIKLNDISYIHNYRSQNYSINENDLSPYAEVKFRVSENVHNPNYRVKNGDAAFLDKGTIVYSLKGYSPSMLVAAKRDGRFLIFEADTNPKAKKGSDLLDIGGKVEYIGINAATYGGIESAEITDKTEVDKLVGMITAAPVDQKSRVTGTQQYSLEFHLKDGITIQRSFWLDTGIMIRGITLPQEFVTAIRSALSKD